MVSLLHRQAVRAKAEGLFFQVSQEHVPRVSCVGGMHAYVLSDPVRYPP